MRWWRGERAGGLAASRQRIATPGEAGGSRARRRAPLWNDADVARAGDRGASWSAAAGGLRRSAWVLGLVTLASVALQLYTTWVGLQLRLEPERAAEWTRQLGAGGLSYRLFYSLAMVVLAAALLAVSRVPSSTRAVTPALLAAVAFGAASVFNVLSLGHAGDGSADPALFVLIAARSVGLVALLVAVLLIADALRCGVRGARRGALIGLGLVDLVVPASRLFVREHSDTWTTRLLLVSLQLAFAALLVRALLLASRAAASQGTGERTEPASEPAPASEPVPAPAVEPAPQPARSPAALGRSLPVGRRLSASLGVLLGVGLLPAWEIATDARYERAELGRLYGLDAPSPEGAWILGALLLAAPLLALWLWRALAESPHGARLACAVAILLGAGHAVWAVRDAALHRAHQVRAWPVCAADAGEVSATIDGVRGPHATDGTPCVRLVERQVQKESPVSVQEGIVQISARFPTDRWTLGVGSLSVLLSLGVAAFVSFRRVD